MKRKIIDNSDDLENKIKEYKKKKQFHLKNTIKNIVSSKIIKNTFYKYIYSKKKYELSNSSSLIGLSLKEIPLRYLIVNNKYFFDIRELFKNIAHIKYHDISSIICPYTRKRFNLTNLRYIKYVIKNYKFDLVNYTNTVLLGKNNNSNSILIVKIHNEMTKFGLFFNSELFMSFHNTKLNHLFTNLEDYDLIFDFVIDFNIKLHYYILLEKKQRTEILLKKLYEIVSYKDKDQVTRCIIVDDIINNIDSN